MQNRNLLIGFILMFSASASSIAQATASAPAPSAAAATTIIPALVRYGGVAQARGRSSAMMTFAIFKDEQGGEPLWTETQNVFLDASGHYDIYLGSTSGSGLPLDLFGNGEARWLEVQAAGEKQQPRVLLASVPYAMKAVDATTLGGLPVSAFALAGATISTQSAGSVAPDASASTVTTPGGTSGYLSVFSGSTAIDDSILFESGTKIGIDTKTPASTLDVNGGITSRGALTMESTGLASSSAPKSSEPVDLMASAWNSSTKKAVNPVFALQAETVGNNTSAPGGTLNLLYGNGANPAETGLSISNNGIIKFAAGQTFPGSVESGTITGVKAGTDLTGGGTSGAVTLNLDTTKVPTLTGNPVFTGTVTFNNSQTSQSQSYAAVKANTSGRNAWSVYGLSSGAIGAGVVGKASGPNGIGVEGITSNGAIIGVGGAYEGEGIGFGVEGLTTGFGAGVIGTAGSGESQTLESVVDYFAGGLWGDTTDPDQVAVIGTADTALAGYFLNNSANTTIILRNDAISTASNDPSLLYALGSNGQCVIDVNGNLDCSGNISGTSSTQGGTHQVETYAMQSAESWLEDAGTAELHNGVTHIDLESTFGQTVNAGVAYHVFLTPNGDCRGLYVSAKSSGGFDVRELGGGTSSIAFDYRIMAKRAGHENERLVDVTERTKKRTAYEAKIAPVHQAGQGLAGKSLRKLGFLNNPDRLSR
jgi:hypothetical protein